MSKEKFNAVKGMNDILPDDAALWEHLEEVLRGWLKSYGYRNMRAPILEKTGLLRVGLASSPMWLRKKCSRSLTV